QGLVGAVHVARVVPNGAADLGLRVRGVIREPAHEHAVDVAVDALVDQPARTMPSQRNESLESKRPVTRRTPRPLHAAVACRLPLYRTTGNWSAGIEPQEGGASSESTGKAGSASTSHRRPIRLRSWG